MSFAETFAAHLARAVDLFRDPEKKEDQKREFRALVTMLQEQGATVQAVGGRISVNGDLADGPQLHPLLQRLELHGVSELTIPQDVPLSQVFALLRAPHFCVHGATHGCVPPPLPPGGAATGRNAGPTGFAGDERPAAR
ncbi:MAG: hypothetical protein AUH42_03350 [Gemmatimonadetes bacterium 13_1_40CM_70_11]|nr:MAG: hypothetical protein AUH42_03350 [Gemmatimonadetes bacterium 13_1_40CM_70_11]